MNEVTDFSAATPGVASEDARYRPAVLKELNQAVESQRMPLRSKNYVLAALHAPRQDSRPRGLLKGRHPSQRMGVSFAIHHGWLGIAALERLERDPKVIIYFDEPPKIKVSCQKNNRKTSYLTAPTYAAVEAHRTVLIELQPEEKLRASEESGSGLYACNDGIWTCPSAQAYAASLGFEHEVWTETGFNRQQVSNLKLLNDYYVESSNVEPELLEATEAVRSAVLEIGAPTFDELLNHLGGHATVDDLFRSIVRAKVFVDLEGADLTRYSKVRVFSDPITLKASIEADAAIAKAATWSPAYARPLKVHEKVFWNGAIAEVVNVGPIGCTFRVDKTLTSLSHAEINDLGDSLRRLAGSAALQDARRADALDALVNVPSLHQAAAIARLKRIEPYLAGLATAPSSRTVRRYLAQYRVAEVTHGNGFLGLIPKYANSGNRVRRLGCDTVKTVNEVIEHKYADPRNLRRIHVYHDAALTCEEKGLPVPSYSWFCRHLKTLDQYKLKVAREGTKAAYPILPRRAPTDAELNVDIEPVRAWERAHIDHTEIDLETIFSETGENLGRCWLTVMIDHHSRRCLSWSISYEPPSYRAVLLVFRACVKRFGRLPDLVVIDGGKEFRSVYFESLCAFYSVKIVRRPARKPRYGAQGERFFGTENTMLLHNLTGNTQLTKNVRQMMPNVDPKKLAVWTLPDLYPLHERFFTEYEGMPHRELLMTPIQVWERSVAMFGTRPGRHIEYSEKFLLATCPSPDKGTAKVTASGVKINYFWFNSDVLFPLIGKQVQVKYEPYDLSTAWAYVNRRWVRLTSRFHRTLRGLTERELHMITEEYRQRRGKVEFKRLNDRKLILFLREIEKEEAFLLERKRAKELQRVLEIATNSEPPETESRANAGTSKDAQHESAPAGVDDDMAAEFAMDLDDADLTELDTY